MSKKKEADVWDAALRELDRWTNAGLRAKFWVRDDDAVEVSEGLKRLRDLGARHRVRIGLALIPGQLSSGLGRYLDDGLQPFYPMCHGWKHVNHNQKHRPAEFGPDRPIEELISDARTALQAFNNEFRSAKAIFVPPFNRATPALIKSLPKIGFFGVSLMPEALERNVLKLGSRLNRGAPIKLPDFKFGHRIDVHIDVVDWQARTAQRTEVIADQIVQQLRGRRLGFLRSDAPIGLLTHHLVHDERIWSLCHDMLRVLRSHDAVEFLDVGSWADACATDRATTQRASFA